MSELSGAGLPARYPISCPHCASVAGLPAAVMTVADDPRALRMDFKCTECHHKWWQQFDNHFAIAPPDRSPAAETDRLPRRRPATIP